mgnify:CR=1 FL=1
MAYAEKIENFGDSNASFVCERNDLTDVFDNTDCDDNDASNVPIDEDGDGSNDYNVSAGTFRSDYGPGGEVCFLDEDGDGDADGDSYD